MTDDLVKRVLLSGGLKLARAVRARIEQDAATIARLEGERERLALAICGGEDAPGYANAQTVEALEKVARDNGAAAMWQIDRTMKAEAKVAALVAGLEKLSCKCSSNCDWDHDDVCPSWTARAAIAAAKGATIDSEDRKGGE